MIELREEDIKKFEGHSSKGNQLKWYRDLVWYKADYTGYEGLSEFVISRLLSKSSLKKSEFVLYDTEKIQYKRTSFNGVKSGNFLADGYQLITLSRLYNLRYNRDFTKDLFHIHDMQGRLSFLVDQVERMTNLKDFGIYISKMLTIDAIFLNEDRHLHNVAVLMRPDGSFEYCPFFDQGAGLLADTTLDYPMGSDVYELMSEVKSKTVCQSFDEALDAAEQLYGHNIYFTFCKKDVTETLLLDDVYDIDIKRRVETILFEQMRKYQYLFK